MVGKLIRLTITSKFTQCFHYLIFRNTGTVKYHKSSTTGTGNLAPRGTGFAGSYVDLFHKTVGNAVCHPSFLLKSKIQDLTDLIQTPLKQRLLHHLRLLL